MRAVPDFAQVMALPHDDALCFGPRARVRSHARAKVRAVGRG
jgi:hypothetical protein